jgi:uncharacterized protein
MNIDDIFHRATSGLSRVPEDWMPATGTRAFVFEDPILVWLDFHGEADGFSRDSSPYEFTEFIFEKGRQFEEKWISEMAPGAVRVCSYGYESRQAEKFRQTLELIDRGTPVIASPALWWGPERVFGVPDLLVRSAWLRERFPAIDLQSASADYYVVIDLKFTTRLDSTEKKLSLSNYAAQVRIYSYIVGHLVGVMPARALLVCRDRIDNPLDVMIHSVLGSPLDNDLRGIRDRYLDIKLNGGSYRPGVDPQIASNLSNDQDDPWHSAKLEIARNRVPGGDPCLLYEIGTTQRQALAAHGYGDLTALMEPDPDQLPLESCKGLGAAKCPRIRAVVRANRTGRVTPEKLSRIPTVRPFEFYVDFETFNNLNVDFAREWPTLQGCEMIFMIGTAWLEDGKWQYQVFIADAESQTRERHLLEEFEDFIGSRTDGRVRDPSSAVLFHWTSAEVWQLRRACDRHGLAPGQILRTLPWYDIQKEVFLAEPVGIPGALGYGLKEVASALGLLKWPGDLDDGLRASVAAWKAYGTDQPLNSIHMNIVKEYNEVDCKALHELVRWLRHPTRR